MGAELTAAVCLHHSYDPEGLVVPAALVAHDAEMVANLADQGSVGGAAGGGFVLESGQELD